MTRGIIIFAFNNETIDYVKLAKYAATKAKTFLQVPVTLITDQNISCDEIIDNVIVLPKENSQNRIFHDGAVDNFVDEWNNVSRHTCYDLSPYDETLVIDCDYIVNSTFLNCCWGKSSDFLIFKDSFDLASWRTIKEFNQISDCSIDFYWATVFYFKKTQKNKLFFTLVAHIKDNWSYYMMMYQTLSWHYRNDIAYSIAIHMLNGFSTQGFAEIFPAKIAYSIDKDYIIDHKDSKMKFLLEHPSIANEYVVAKTEDIDIHVMNKMSLLRLIDQKELHV